MARWGWLLLLGLLTPSATVSAQTIGAPTGPGGGPAPVPAPYPGATPPGAAAPATAYTVPTLPGPYFQPDPRLEPPPVEPGWFLEAELGIVVPHLKNQLSGTVQFPGADAVTVSLPAAGLDVTVAPRLEVGYRLPSAFGEFSLGYRFLATQGTSSLTDDVGVSSLRSRLDFNQVDLDYASREFISLGPDWDMKWRFGLRLLYLYFDSRLSRSAADALATDGNTEIQTTNSYVGFGPHAALELGKRLGDSGLSVAGKVDLATELGRIRQGFSETSLLTDASGLPLVAETRQSGSQVIPMVDFQLGLSWQPPQWPWASLFLGYEYEFWANTGRYSSGASRGDLTNQGVVLRSGINF